MPPYTILFFTDSDDFGGAERVLANLLSGLDRQRWSPVLFYHDTPGISPLVRYAKEINTPVKAVRPMPLGIKGAWRSLALAMEIRRLEPDVFHANLTWPLSGKYGLIAALLARVKVVVAGLHTFVEIPYGPFSTIQKRFIVSRIDKYIVVSNDLANQMKRTFSLPSEKIQVIYNGIQAEKYFLPANPAHKTKLLGSEGRPIILTTARLENQKGLNNLLQAAVLVPQADFVLAGEGSLRGELENQARELGVSDRVTFLGYQENVGELLSACDIFVLPSLYEAFGLSILEAMAAGKPVVASRVGGIVEVVIHEETGLLVPPGDPDQLARSIHRLLYAPELSKQYGEAGKARLQREFTIDRMFAEYESTYETLLVRKGNRRRSFDPTQCLRKGNT